MKIKKRLDQFIFDPDAQVYHHPDGRTITYQDGGESYVFEAMKKVRKLYSKCSGSSFQNEIRELLLAVIG